MTKNKRNNAGFTLVELMVVVGIIGVLSSIAIPSYEGFRAKARQTEAKLQLSSIYTAETTFSMENQTYTTCLSDTVFSHSFASINYFYAVGFASASASCGNTGTASCHIGPDPSVPCQSGAFPAGAFYPATRAIAGSPVSMGVFTADVSTSITTIQFTAAAMGSISSLGATLPDTWTIDQLQNLANTRSGI